MPRPVAAGSAPTISRGPATVRRDAPRRPTRMKSAIALFGSATTDDEGSSSLSRCADDDDPTPTPSAPDSWMTVPGLSPTGAPATVPALALRCVVPVWWEKRHEPA